MNIKNEISKKSTTSVLVSAITGFLNDRLSTRSNVDLPRGTKLVTCQIVKPNGANANSPIEVLIGGNKIFWGTLIKPNKKGNISLPAIASEHKNKQEYFCYISTEDGYWGTHDSSLIHEGAKIPLKIGGRINTHWIGSGLPLDNFSFESYQFPEISLGLNSTYNHQRQLPPGPFIINALSSSCSNDTIIRYTKYGLLEANRTVTLNLGEKIKDYEIRCLLPQDQPSDLKLTLTLQVDPNQNSKIKPYFCLIKEANQQEIPKMAAAEEESFYFKNWPIDVDGMFRFIADETCAKVIITAIHGNRVLPILSVEFGIDEVRTKTVDLQKNEALLNLLMEIGDIQHDPNHPNPLNQKVQE